MRDYIVVGLHSSTYSIMVHNHLSLSTELLHQYQHQIGQKVIPPSHSRTEKLAELTSGSKQIFWKYETTCTARERRSGIPNVTRLVEGQTRYELKQWSRYTTEWCRSLQRILVIRRFKTNWIVN